MSYVRWSSLLGLKSPDHIPAEERWQWHFDEDRRITDLAKTRYPGKFDLHSGEYSPLQYVNILAEEEGLHVSCWYIFDGGRLEVWHCGSDKYPCYDSEALTEIADEGAWDRIEGYGLCQHPLCDAAMQRAVKDYIEELQNVDEDL